MQSVKAEEVAGRKRKRDRLRTAINRLFTRHQPVSKTKTSSTPQQPALSRTPTNHQDDIYNDPLAQLCRVQDPRLSLAKTPLVKVGQGRAGAVFTTGSGDSGTVAVKEIQVPMRERHRSRLVLEVSALRQLQQTPGVIKLLDAYLFQQGADRKVWLVMEWAANGPLTAVVTKVRLTEPQMSVVTRQLLEALDSCHRHGWIHRDVKSDNVLIMSDGECRLADFGAAACKSDQSPNTPSEAVGTPHWTAPEAITANQWSVKADVWSVGCVLVEMVTGEPPLWSLSQEQLLAGDGVKYDDRPFINSGSPQLRHFANQLLQVDPNQRLSVQQALLHPFITAYANLQPSVLLTAVQKCRRLQ